MSTGSTRANARTVGGRLNMPAAPDEPAQRRNVEVVCDLDAHVADRTT